MWIASCMVTTRQPWLPSQTRVAIGRTRHLRLRAFALREALAAPSRKWVARHLVGTLLLADGFTKPLLGSLI